MLVHWVNLSAILKFARPLWESSSALFANLNDSGIGVARSPEYGTGIQYKKLFKCSKI